MAKPIPPKIAPKPGHVKVVRALHNYTAQQPDELTFSEGDVLYILDQTTDPTWWRARCGKNCGLIPYNYVESKTENLDNPLHECARRGNMEFLLECLNQGVSPTGLDSTKNSPLHWASRAGHLDCVKEIVHFASTSRHQIPKQFVNVQNKMGETPLHLASAKDRLDVVGFLLENSADPTIRNLDNQLPIDLCHEPQVKAILQNRTSSSEKEAEEYLDDDSDED